MDLKHGDVFKSYLIRQQLEIAAKRKNSVVMYDTELEIPAVHPSSSQQTDPISQEDILDESPHIDRYICIRNVSPDRKPVKFLAFRKFLYSMKMRFKHGDVWLL